MHNALPSIIALVVVLAVFVTAAWACLRGAPWLPTPTRDIVRMLEMADLKAGEILYDLGCGDGRVCAIAAERYHARAVGYEMSVLPYLAAQVRRVCSARRSAITIRFHDFRFASLEDADVIFCFLTPATMRKMKTKFVQECALNARILSSTFRIDGWQEAASVRPPHTKNTHYLYRLPASIAV